MSLRVRLSRLVLPVGVVTVAGLAACGSSKGRSGFDDDQAGPPPTGFGTDGGGLGEGGVKPGEDPATCEQAAESKSYVGCDYWPTVTANLVQSVFDYAVAVANVGKDEANVTVTGPNGTNEKISVAGGALGVVYLPWVSELKGDELTGSSNTVLSHGGAYHLVSDHPVVVYQFNPIEFRAAGGPPGKDWTQCQQLSPTAPDCYSYSNDASLLLPSTAMTGAYRLMGSAGWTRSGGLGGTELGAVAAITATVDGTKVDLKLGPNASTVAGGGIAAGAPGDTISFTLDAGDVAEIATQPGSRFDLSGSLLIASSPVQVITGVPCQDMPEGKQACDHIEETVFPAETIGKHYVVLTPTGPKENDVGQVVRFFGNADGTTLSYSPSKPSGCPDTLDAGQVVDCGVVTSDFEVSGTEAFGVATFLLGGEVSDPDFDPNGLTQPQGDPSQTFQVAVEQYRQKYVFLAPTDYKTSFVDVVADTGTTITVDGKDASGELSDIAGTPYQKARIKLGSGKNGVHTLESDKPVGIQVIGYGDNTSYQYPGGLNLGRITAVPPK
jgi:hypothetical protein